MSRKSDHELGMDRPITRRDLFHGAAVVGAGLFAARALPAGGEAQAEQIRLPPPAPATHQP